MVKATGDHATPWDYDKPNLRKMVEAILYRMRVGCPWRDLPVEFGFWNSIYQQFNPWSTKNKLMKIFKDLVQNPDLAWAFNMSLMKPMWRRLDVRTVSKIGADNGN